MKKSIDRKSQNNCPYEKGKYQLVGAELFHDTVSPFFNTLSRPGCTDLSSDTRILTRQRPKLRRDGRAQSEIRYPIHYVSSPKAECSTLTASSVYFSSIMHEILISEVLINMMLMFSAARVANILDATPE